MSAGDLWDDVIAERVAAATDPGRPIVVASGISPSGPIHMGNLREVFTTHLVAEALHRRGREVVHLHSWDDYDRFRKVPAGVDASFERYVGMPLAAIPGPDGGAGSYAEHFMDELRASLDVLGIQMTEVRQSKRYPSGVYNGSIRRAMDERGLVFDTLAGQQTPGRHERPREERRREYYPFKPYCPVCGTDNTRVTGYGDETVRYECRCDHSGEMSLADGARISGKLVWKVDWPMRWAYERVAFEPAGEDHHAPTGSFTVGRTLVFELYGGQAPDSVVYSFVSLAGVGGKMSGSVGGAAIPATALDVIEPAIVRWLYIRRLPAQSFAVDLSPRAIQRLYDEWDRLETRVASGEAEPSEVAVHRQSVESSAGPVLRTARPVSFRLLASVADITQGNRAQIARIVSAHLEVPAPTSETLLAELEPRLGCAIRFANEVVPEDDRTRVRSEFARDAYEQLDENMRRGVGLLADGLAGHWSIDGLTTLVYAVPKTLQGLAADAEPNAELKAAQRTFFKAVYQLLVDAETGPRLPTLLLSIGQDFARRLLVGD